MVKKKSGSKREKLRTRTERAKKVREHKRKQKKFANRNPEKAALLKRMRQSQRVERGIPSSHPLKDHLLKQVEEAKRRREEQVEAKKAARKEARQQNLLAKRLGVTAADLVASAQDRARDFENAAEGADEDGMVRGDGTLGQQSRRAYLRELKKVVNASDVVLHVVDARDPLGSFSEAIEEAVRRYAEKRLVIVVNKADLVPREALCSWLQFFRRRAPTLAFKASTAGGEQRLKQLSGDASQAAAGALRGTASIGAETLLNLLKNYCRTGGLKSTIAVGCVGYPNVGKSSLINSLKRVRAVGVSSTAGFTKAMQEVVLDKHIRLIDSPGVVFADGDSASTALRNVVDPDSLDDPISAAEGILQRVPVAALQAKYVLPSSVRASTHAFLAGLGRRLGRVRKGGVPDKEAAARTLLRDWNTGRIPFYTLPPEDANVAAFSAESQLVGGFGKEVDLEALESENADIMDALPDNAATDMIQVQGAQGRAAGAPQLLWDDETGDAGDAAAMDDSP